jgi:tryptophan synthase alpha subunit
MIDPHAEEAVEVVEAEVVVLEQPRSGVLVQQTATQAALVAAGGFAVGAATVAAVKRHRSTKAAKRSRKALGQIVGSRRFLVDVHLLRD